jgi:lysophospholipase L1-like esterase
MWQVARRGLVFVAGLRRAAGLLALAGTVACAAPAPPTPSTNHRWRASLAEFAAADQARRPAAGGVVFVGSSSIRLWPRLAQEFGPGTPVINRGFGGSTLADCHAFAWELVVQYRPRQVVVYAGDNDLAEGRTPAQVLESFKGFVAAVRQELPAARIDFISIKPSPLRAALVPQAREANALLAAYVATLPDAGFIDVFTPMLDAAGAPRADLYGPDRLHMNAAGYALWRELVGPQLRQPPGEPPPRN